VVPDTLVLVVLGVGGLYYLDTVEVVLEAAVEVADRLADVGVPFLGQLHEPVCKHRRHRDDHECHEGELRIEPEQHERDAGDEHTQLDGFAKHVVEEQLEPVRIVREDRHQLTCLNLVEKLHIEALHPLVRCRPDLVFHTV
jgi:hypothetical protein